MRRHLLEAVGVMILCSFFFPSCVSTRPLTYMQGSFDTAALSQVNIPEATVRKGDLLSIIVYSDNPEATLLFNQPLITVSGGAGSGGGSSGGAATGTAGGSGGGSGSTAGAIGGGSPTSPGYQVDENGDIWYQTLGLLHVEGMTKAQLKDLLDSKLKKYLNNPYYTIRFVNYRFTMLGEVQHPGIFSIPGEHVSMLEAIGLAGDLTLYGRRDNILIIRENEGKREFARIDLTKPQVLASPYFYLQQNDVIYIEATKKKLLANDQATTRNITIAATIISALAIVISLLRN